MHRGEVWWADRQLRSPHDSGEAMVDRITALPEDVMAKACAAYRFAAGC